MSSFTPLPTFGVATVFDFSPSHKCVVTFHCGLSLYVSRDNKVEHILCAYLLSVYPLQLSFCSCLFVQFLIGLFICLL